MSHSSPEAIKKQVTVYIRVFLALAALTVVTVGISYIHLPLTFAILLALFVASIKASLVAAYFMHLKGEKRIIWSFLILATVFVIVLLAIPVWHNQ